MRLLVSLAIDTNAKWLSRNFIIQVDALLIHKLNEVEQNELCYNSSMKKESILAYLTDIKNKYQDEGFVIKALFGSYSRDEADANSDVDILVEATPAFANKYGFGAISRIREIQAELSQALGLPVDLADSTGMSKTGKKFIIDRAIYV